ncbi:hypothetical protein DCS_06758 [Drechmeria coniospora]|uniref:Translation machinery-associated protein 16 n=1 Tax=Drechmeria coniospora TaxID=98403 RepID=A0A151GCG3_DRECN|nr:hypothetical protein DCS_06758 [Drechmeria coniospora]KYK54798.1 hypothetical protein DCS_06758 [Drechmeria coniospora]ODA75970.1 hypothetical protein RJ55_08611 [Drechmeria coniospora]
MPTSLQKTRKHIAKKRNGEVNALHEKSRDSMRLHKASMRDLRLQKLSSARNKREQPIVDRVAHFQEGLKESVSKPLDIAAVQELIHAFVHQYDDEYDELRKARRPGRPGSTREDLLKLKIAALETEYKNGFLIPDVMQQDSAKLIEDWEGTWANLTTMPWIKVSSSGQARPADFPSKGIN